MRFHIVACLGLALAAIACGKQEARHTYRLQGQVLSVEAPRKLLTIKHEEIKGLMPAMTMPYSVQDAKLLTGLSPGDLVNATLVVVSNDAYLTAIGKVGRAPLETPPAEAPMPPPSPRIDLLNAGDAVPDASFVDQDGRRRRFSGFRGSAVVLTFVYTRCPLPAFCPLMDRHFAAMQPQLAADPLLKKVHLVTVSFDPANDTPAVLKKHAQELGADLARWTFLTGARDDIDRFAARFGVAVTRAPNDARDITHNLRTVIIDSMGRVVRVYTGNDWTPEQILTELKTVA
jgi:protein SCO1/2